MGWTLRVSRHAKVVQQKLAAVVVGSTLLLGAVRRMVDRLAAERVAMEVRSDQKAQACAEQSACAACVVYHHVQNGWMSDGLHCCGGASLLLASGLQVLLLQRLGVARHGLPQ